MPEYLARKAVSASFLHRLLTECPRAAWFDSPFNPNRPPPEPPDDKIDAGIVAHAIVLEQSRAKVQIIDPREFPNKGNGSIPDGWKNPAIRAARDEARAAGKIPVLPADMEAISAMAGAALEFIESLRDTEPAIWHAFQPDGGDSEMSLSWDEDGLLCKARPDRISRDRRLIVDLKFSKRSAEPDGWSRSQLGPMGYRITASFYRRGGQRLFLISPDYVFLVVEQDPPHLCSLVGVDPQNLVLGDDQVEAALATTRQCLATGDWWAYPRRVCYPDVQAYEIARWQERQAVQGIPYDYAKLFPKEAA
jgi:hypothetical protein